MRIIYRAILRLYSSIATEMSSSTRLLDSDLRAIISCRTGDWALGSRTFELCRQMGWIKQRDGLGRTAAFSTFTA